MSNSIKLIHETTRFPLPHLLLDMHLITKFHTDYKSNNIPLHRNLAIKAKSLHITAHD